MPNDRLPLQRWEFYPKKPQLAKELAEKFHLSPLLAQVLINRGIETATQAKEFLEPETQFLPDPLDEFPDLGISLELLEKAIASQGKIAICGDYDADGMTSTALLLRSLRSLGAKVDYAIPSRMTEGYGINCRIIEEFHTENVQLILTVDNGIAALEPIERARELGLQVIVTDHHDIPPKLPPANAILNPKLIRETSPYRGVAGVGVAYILAVCLAQKLGKAKGLVKPMLELFTLGTIADLAPLTGVNRRWVKRGLQLLPYSQLAGVQALIQVSGVESSSNSSLKYQQLTGNSKLRTQNSLNPEDIGFRLGPRINAIGRISDPQIVIDLLTTDDMGIALERAMQCEQINLKRQKLCEEIEQEAIAWCQQSQIDLQQERVLVIVQPNWHHGVIGIVASRLVERYGVPVFIGTYEEEDRGHIRGSARGIPEFDVFEALLFCEDLLGKFGGHKAAGGFSLPGKNLEQFRQKLSEFAHKLLQPEHLKPLLKIDIQAEISDINLELYQQIQALQPCGIENSAPVFWMSDVRILEQQIVGKGHIKLTISQFRSPDKIKAIAWRWRDYFPLPTRVDLAYRLRENNFNGSKTVELEILGVRPGKPLSWQSLTAETIPLKAEFYHNQKYYTCGLYPNNSLTELRIRNAEGKVLAVPLGKTTGLLGKTREDAVDVNILQPPFSSLVEVAQVALERVKDRL
ncbi:single-stranded-DNA-specific exonuclease RecJ [Aerosakkonemataceae cyanobacterium BLCC-F154]|uniref:Single-stranded-DNA-specific exonuclease RecJ n=1 Tax=Floridaenema fluviatile BLCC-F154 TaxID=3153640 RepID=A0ABV4YBS3_9CYAN